MKISLQDKYVFSGIFCALISLHVILIFTIRLFPFVDLPNHLSVATIYRYYGDAGNQFKEFFTIDIFLKPNIFHLLFCSCKIFSSVEFANKIFLSLYIILLPLSVVRCITYFGGNKWYALLSFLFLYNFNVSWGFVGYVIAIPTVLFLFIASLRFFEKTTPVSMLVVMALFVLLYFMHAQAVIFGIVLFFIGGVYLFRKSLLSFLPRCIALLPVLILLVGWWYSYTGHERYENIGTLLFKYWLHDFIPLLHERWSPCVLDNLFLGGLPGGESGALYFSIPIVIMLLLHFWFYGIDGFKHTFKRSIVPAYLLSGVSLICFVFLPHEIPGQWYIYERFSVFWMLSLIIILGLLFPVNKTVLHVRRLPVGRGLICLFILFLCGSLYYMRSALFIAVLSTGGIGCLLYFVRWKIIRTGIMIALVAVHFILYYNYFRTFDSTNQGFQKDIFDAIPKENSFTGTMYDFHYKGLPSYIHFPSYYIIWNQGVTTTVITSFRFATVRVRKQVTHPKYYEWIEVEPDFDLSVYDSIDYILVNGFFPASARSFFEKYVIVDDRGKYRLFKRIQ